VAARGKLLHEGDDPLPELLERLPLGGGEALEPLEAVEVARIEIGPVPPLERSEVDLPQAPLTARFWKNITIGWAGANTVFWNCEGSFLVQKPPTAQNYAFGHIGVDAVVFNIAFQDPTKEGGHIESLDRHVAPRSLYLTQLRERLGEIAEDLGLSGIVAELNPSGLLSLDQMRRTLDILTREVIPTFR